MLNLGNEFHQLVVAELTFDDWVILDDRNFCAGGVGTCCHSSSVPASSLSVD